MDTQKFIQKIEDTVSTKTDATVEEEARIKEIVDEINESVVITVKALRALDLPTSKMTVQIEKEVPKKISLLKKTKIKKVKKVMEGWILPSRYFCDTKIALTNESIPLKYNSHGFWEIIERWTTPLPRLVKTKHSLHFVMEKSWIHNTERRVLTPLDWWSEVISELYRRVKEE